MTPTTVNPIIQIEARFVKLRADFPFWTQEVHGHPPTHLFEMPLRRRKASRRQSLACAIFSEKNNANVHRGIH